MEYTILVINMVSRGRRDTHGVGNRSRCSILDFIRRSRRRSGTGDPDHSRSDQWILAELNDERQRKAVIRPTNKRKEDMLRGDFSRRVGHTAIDEERDIARGPCEDIANKLRIDHGPSLVLHGSLVEYAIERVTRADLLPLCVLVRNLSYASCPGDDDHLRRRGGYVLGNGFREFGKVDYGKRCRHVEMIELPERLVYGDDRIVVDEAVGFLRSKNSGGAVGELHQSKGLNIGRGISVLRGPSFLVDVGFRGE